MPSILFRHFHVLHFQRPPRPPPHPVNQTVNIFYFGYLTSNRYYKSGANHVLQNCKTNSLFHCLQKYYLIYGCAENYISMCFVCTHVQSANLGIQVSRFSRPTHSLPAPTWRRKRQTQQSKKAIVDSRLRPQWCFHLANLNEMEEMLHCKLDAFDPVICLGEQAIFLPAQKCPYHVTFDLDHDLEHTMDADLPGHHRVQVWWRSGHLAARSDGQCKFSTSVHCSVTK